LQPRSRRQRKVIPSSEFGQFRSVHLHVRGRPVAVRLATPLGMAFAMVRAAQTFVVPDHLVARDSVATREPECQRERGGQLPRVAQDLLVARTDMLDADRGPVQSDRVSADEGQPHELVDRPVTVNDEVGAGPGLLAELRVRRVGSEGRPGCRERPVAGVVLHDHVRPDEGRPLKAVMALLVTDRLSDPIGSERQGLPENPRTLRRARRRRTDERQCEGRDGEKAERPQKLAGRLSGLRPVVACRCGPYTRRNCCFNAVA
jgi:hypothetical protein